MLNKMKQTPVPVAVLVMVLCILVGVTFGNKNALDRAVKNSGATLTEIAELTQQRAAKASNLLVICQRSIPGNAGIEALENAIHTLKNATHAGQIAEADRRLTFAAESVRGPIENAATEQDRKLMVGVMDELNSAEKILTRVAGTYNEKVTEVREVYDSLPTKWLLGGVPEVYQ